MAPFCDAIRNSVAAVCETFDEQQTTEAVDELKQVNLTWKQIQTHQTYCSFSLFLSLPVLVQMSFD